MLTAPSMILKMSHRNPHKTTHGMGVHRGSRDSVQNGQRNMPRNPVSRSWASHPETMGTGLSPSPNYCCCSARAPCATPLG